LVRTAAVFGGPHSFPQRILDRARSGEKLRVVSDQHVNPTYAKDLAAAAVELVEDGMAGIVHAVAEGCTGWDDFARAALKELGVSTPVESVGSAAYASAARRPFNGCLATTRYRPLPPWREALHEWASGLKSGLDLPTRQLHPDPPPPTARRKGHKEDKGRGIYVHRLRAHVRGVAVDRKISAHALYEVHRTR